MTISIRGGIADANITEGVYYQKALVLALEYKGEIYYAALNPTNQESMDYTRTVPKKFGSAVEINARRVGKIVFTGEGNIKKFFGKGKNLMLILSSNHGPFSLVFLENSATKLKEKGIGKEELENRPIEIMVEF